MARGVGLGLVAVLPPVNFYVLPTLYAAMLAYPQGTVENLKDNEVVEAT